MGTLIVGDGITEKIIYFSMGGLRMVVDGKARVETLEEILLQKGYTQQKHLEKAKEEQKEKQEKTLGQILVEMGYLDRKKLKEAVIEKVERELEDLFVWQEAEFQFSEGNPPPEFYEKKQQSLSISFDIDAFLRKFQGKEKKWDSIAKEIYSPRLVFEKAEENIDTTQFDKLEQKVLESLDGNTSIENLEEKLGLARNQVYETIYNLQRKKVIQKISASKQKEIESKADLEEIRKLEEALDKAVEQIKIRMRLVKLYEKNKIVDKAAQNYHILGDLVAKENPEQAIGYYEKAVDYDPQNLPLHKKIFNYYRNTNQIEKATERGFRFANLLRGFGLLNRAKEFFVQLVQMAPRKPEIRKGYAEVLEELDQRQEALQQYEAYAQLAKEKNNQKEYIQALEKMQKLDDTNIQIRRRLRLAQGKSQWSLQDLDFWLTTKIFIGVLASLILLAFGYELVARSAFVKAGNQARLLMRQKEFQKAREALEEVKNNYPLSTIVLYAQDLLDECNELEAIEKQNQSLQRLEEALVYEFQAKYASALKLYQELASSTSLAVKKVAKGCLQRLSKEKEKVQKKWEQSLSFSSLQEASDQEVETVFAQRKRLLKKYGSFIQKPRLPMRIYPYPHGAELILNGNPLPYGEERAHLVFSPLEKNILVMKMEDYEFPNRIISLNHLNKGVVRLSLHPFVRVLDFGGMIYGAALNADKSTLFVFGQNIAAYDIEGEKILSSELGSFPEEWELDFPKYFKGWMTIGLAKPVFAKEHFWLSLKEGVYRFSLKGRQLQARKVDLLQKEPLGVPVLGVENKQLLFAKGAKISSIYLPNPYILWSYSLDAPLVGEPVQVGNMVYFLTQKRSLYEMNIRISSHPPQKIYQAKEDFSSTLVVAQGILFLPTTSSLIAYNVAKQRTLWKIPIPEGVIGLAVLRSRYLLVSTSGGELLCIKLDKHSPKTVWRYRFRGTFATTPFTILNRWIYVGCQNGMLYAFSFEEDRERLQLEWFYPTDAAIYAPILNGEKDLFVITVGGKVYQFRK